MNDYSCNFLKYFYVHIDKDLYCIIQYPYKNCMKQQRIRNGIHTDSRITNCGTDWVGEKVVDRETDRCVRWIKEAIWNRGIEPTINRDEAGLQTQSHLGQSARHAIWPAVKILLQMKTTKVKC